MENSRAPGSGTNNHQHVTLKHNLVQDHATEAFARAAGPDHQHVILRRQIRSDRTPGPDHQHVVLKRTKGSSQTDPTKEIPELFHGNNHQTVDTQQIDAQGVLKPACTGKPPMKSETVDHPKGKPQPAEVYIFNHQDFVDRRKNREGSSKDVEALRKTFEKLQCKVNEIQNPTLSMVKHEVWKMAVKKFEHQSALVVVILSHGQRKEIIETCDQNHYNLDDDVLFPLFGNQTLRGKPKILIVQACKGAMTADASPIENCCDPRDYIKCYSTTEGFLSYRHEIDGTIYIQTLCKVMDQDALTKDFRRIIEDVNAKVAEESLRSYKQVPAMTNTMYRPYCFGDYMQHSTT